MSSRLRCYDDWEMMDRGVVKEKDVSESVDVD